jgi:uncharacterized membrane protein YqjE
MNDRDRSYAEEHSLGELFSDLTTETRTLIRQELELAKTELTEKASRAGRDAGIMAGGAVVLYMGLLALAAAAVIALGHLIGYAHSALIVGVILAGAGAAMVLTAKNDLQKMTLTPEETKKTVKETKLWLKQQTH